MEPGIILFVAAVGGLVGMIVGSDRKMGAGGGFFVGMILGPIGWILTAMSPKAEPEVQPEPASLLDRIERRHEAAGWYPDPLGRFDQRWFDGQRWTQHVGRVGPDGAHLQLEDPL